MCEHMDGHEVGTKGTALVPPVVPPLVPKGRETGHIYGFTDFRGKPAGRGRGRR